MIRLKVQRYIISIFIVITKMIPCYVFNGYITFKKYIFYESILFIHKYKIVQSYLNCLFST